jgi:hypothetical protein
VLLVKDSEIQSDERQATQEPLPSVCELPRPAYDSR